MKKNNFECIKREWRASASNNNDSKRPINLQMMKDNLVTIIMKKILNSNNISSPNHSEHLHILHILCVHIETININGDMEIIDTA